MYLTCTEILCVHVVKVDVIQCKKNICLKKDQSTYIRVLNRNNKSKFIKDFCEMVDKYVVTNVFYILLPELTLLTQNGNLRCRL